MAALPRDELRSFFSGLQDRVCEALEGEDRGSRFRRDSWSRPQAGGGITGVLENGEVFERAGAAFSHVEGKALPEAATRGRPGLAGRPWEALGVSVVVHPRNPHVPTSHMNVRFLATDPDARGETVWWFGGGFDLTPYYGYREDCEHWHGTAHALCAPFGPDVYADFKRRCDDYFVLPHRNEPRGIGGIFFDDLDAWGFARTFEFVRGVGRAYLDAYLPIVRRRRDVPWGERERAFQLYRRGRYVEFNLVWDRGTLFGLQSGGRTESILVSMPPQVSWRYDWSPEPGSPEAALYEDYLKPRDWV